MKEVTIPVKLTIGTLREIGFGGLKAPWVSASTEDGRECEVTTGAGLGNPLLEASVKRDGQTLYAKADTAQFVPLIWEAITAAMDEVKPEARG